MAIITKKYVEDDCLLGIWEITETYDELLSQVILSEEEKEELEGFKSNARKLEYLSVRALLLDLAQTKEKIIYNSKRKPFLQSGSHFISISHSFHYTSILLSKNKRVGLDLEYMSHRISSIAHKFINNQEFITDDPDYKRYHLYIHWCAKEALYKICDKQDINFKYNLTITPFEFAEKGEIEGIVTNKYGTEKFKINYFKRDKYTVAWCAKEKSFIDKLFNFAPREIFL